MLVPTPLQLTGHQEDPKGTLFTIQTKPAVLTAPIDPKKHTKKYILKLKLTVFSLCTVLLQISSEDNTIETQILYWFCS
jgi:hypothetical protein